MTSPDITFRTNIPTYTVLSSLAYVQTKDGGTNLPVLQGENSDNLYLRIYNNYALAAGVANALNVHVTTYDGAGINSHTAFTAPVSQMWVHVFLNAYGEGATTPGASTSYVGANTAVGGVSNKYLPEKGSDGTLGQSRVRAGTNNNGCGFIELESYVSVPSNASNTSYQWVMTADYEWSS